MKILFKIAIFALALMTTSFSYASSKGQTENLCLKLGDNVNLPSSGYMHASFLDTNAFSKTYKTANISNPGSSACRSEHYNNSDQRTINLQLVAYLPKVKASNPISFDDSCSAYDFSLQGEGTGPGKYIFIYHSGEISQDHTTENWTLTISPGQSAQTYILSCQHQGINN